MLQSLAAFERHVRSSVNFFYESGKLSPSPLLTFFSFSVHILFFSSLYIDTKNNRIETKHLPVPTSYFLWKIKVSSERAFRYNLHRKWWPKMRIAERPRRVPFVERTRRVRGWLKHANAIFPNRRNSRRKCESRARLRAAAVASWKQTGCMETNKLWQGAWKLTAIRWQSREGKRETQLQTFLSHINSFQRTRSSPTTLLASLYLSSTNDVIK